jgi:predicted transcriptional regulator of viral defense system
LSAAKLFERAIRSIRRKGSGGPATWKLSAFLASTCYVSTVKENLAGPARGIYTLPDAAVTERHSYAEVSKRVPEAILCLLSALAFHGFTTQSPASVWIALGKGARKPAILSPSLRVVRLTEPSLCEGVEEHTVEGVPVRVYSAAKTVADCFKFRNKIGLDVAIEALKDSLSQKKATINYIYRYAKICRVSNVIRPYMEAL